MSVLLIGTDLEALAQRCASDLDEAAVLHDPLAPHRIVVPNHNLRTWLRFFIARQQGIAFNLHLGYLEHGLWEVLRELDPREEARELRLVQHERYRLMLLSLLLDPPARAKSDLAPLLDYLGTGERHSSRDFARRAWQLADRLATHIRDYEYHRPALIQAWLNNNLFFDKSAPFVVALERAQRALFQEIVRPDDGVRERWGRTAGKRWVTLPQYAYEVFEELDRRPPARVASGPIHLFGLSQMSVFHEALLRRLAAWVELRLYHYNPLASSLAPPCSSSAQALRRAADPASAPEPSARLLKGWGEAGRRTLTLLAGLLEGSNPFNLEVVQAPQGKKKVGPPNVLTRVQNQLLGAEEKSAQRLEQDVSLQVASAPSLQREVETVYQSILDNLKRDPSLGLGDIAVLVTDLDAYRTVMRSVFEREPRQVAYNLSDFSASGQSLYAQALTQLLELADAPLKRDDVLAVLMNPCCLQAVGASREDALVWNAWARRLRVFHTLNARDKEALAWGSGPLYTWQLALQRLRLGRIMDLQAPGTAEPLSAWKDRVPFADLQSGEVEHLAAFGRAVEALLFRLRELRTLSGSGHVWRDALRALAEAHLAVPPGHEAEDDARRELFAAFDELAELDAVAGGPLSLPLVREFVLARTQELEGALGGGYLSGGVTVSALRPLRPVPFRLVYILGLGEGLFPGHEIKSALDLRQQEEQPGDIRVPEANRFLFLESLLSVRGKLYLSYVGRDLQKDAVHYPCSVLEQLRRHLEERVLPQGVKFESVQIPFSAGDARYFQKRPERPQADVLAEHRTAARWMALHDPATRPRIQLTATQQRQLNEHAQRSAHVLPVAREREQARDALVTLRELVRVLKNPAAAGIRRHLRLQDEDDDDPGEFEPFFTASFDAARLKHAALWRYLELAADGAGPLPQRERLQELFAAEHRAARLQGLVPEGAFGELDAARLQRELEAPQAQLEKRFEHWRAQRLYRSVVLGADPLAVQAGLRFPALRLPLGRSAVSITGSQGLVMYGADALETVVLTQHAKVEQGLPAVLFEPLLFYLALAAGQESGEHGSSAAWLAERPLRVQYACREGAELLEFKVMPASQAREFLTDLCAAFLDTGSFDLLPYDLIHRNKELYAALLNDPAMQPKEFSQALEEAIEEDQDAEHGSYWPEDVERLAAPSVPTDALEKLRRRFQPLTALRVNAPKKEAADE